MRPKLKPPIYQKKWFIPVIIIIGITFMAFTFMDVRSSLKEVRQNQEPRTTRETETGELMVGGCFSTDKLCITVENFKNKKQASEVTLNVGNLGYEIERLNWKDIKILDSEKNALTYKVQHETELGDDEGLHLPGSENAEITFIIDKATAQYFQVDIEGYDTAVWDLSKEEDN